MIIARAPFRIPLGGGGTDLPLYAEARGGHLISAAINRYIYISVHRRQLDKLLWLNYSERETQRDVTAIKHHLIREALKLAGVTAGVEIHSMTELSERSGLGGSSTFLIALLRALAAYRDVEVSKNTLAEDAVHIERVILKNHGGIQDQYIAAHGGLCRIENSSLTNVRVHSLPVKQEVLDRLTRNLLLFYTGVQRSSAVHIKAQEDERTRDEFLGFYDTIRDIGRRAERMLLDGNLHGFGETFHEHWMLKRSFTTKMTNGDFDRLYDRARREGAIGGKLVGAGGGGFFLFYVPTRQTEFCERFGQLGLTHVPFSFDWDGATIIHQREF